MQNAIKTDIMIQPQTQGSLSERQEVILPDAGGVEGLDVDTSFESYLVDQPVAAKAASAVPIMQLPPHSRLLGEAKVPTSEIAGDISDNPLTAKDVATSPGAAAVISDMPPVSSDGGEAVPLMDKRVPASNPQELDAVERTKQSPSREMHEARVPAAIEEILPRNANDDLTKGQALEVETTKRGEASGGAETPTHQRDTKSASHSVPTDAKNLTDNMMKSPMAGTTPPQREAVSRLAEHGMADATRGEVSAKPIDADMQGAGVTKALPMDEKLTSVTKQSDTAAQHALRHAMMDKQVISPGKMSTHTKPSQGDEPVDNPQRSDAKSPAVHAPVTGGAPLGTTPSAISSPSQTLSPLDVKLAKSGDVPQPKLSNTQREPNAINNLLAGTRVRQVYGDAIQIKGQQQPFVVTDVSTLVLEKQLSNPLFSPIGVDVITSSRGPDVSGATTSTMAVASSVDAAKFTHVSRQLMEVAARHADGPVELTLSPEELGRVRMNFTVQDGALTVMVAAERSETMALMRRHIDALIQDFHGVGYSEVNLEFTGSGDRQPTDNPSADEQQNHTTQPADIEHTLNTARLDLGMNGGSGLDLRI